MRLYNHFKFRNALKCGHAGQVTVTKAYCAMTKGQGETIAAYIQGYVIPFLSKQNGMVRYSMHRGLGWGQNSWFVVTEWSTLEDVRKALCSAEACTLRKNAPWSLALIGVWKSLSQITVAGNGPAGRAGETAIVTGRKVVA